MWPITIAAIRPFFTMWTSSNAYSSRIFIQPAGAPQVHADGSDADRILVAGDAFSISYGVLSHDLDLAGQLARRLSTLTGRGADIDIIADSRMSAETCTIALRDVDFSRYDALVLSIGGSDARALTSVTRWRAQLADLLAFVAREAPGLNVFVLGLPNVTRRVGLPRVFAELIDRQIRIINSSTAITCDSRSRVTLIPANPRVHIDTSQDATRGFEERAAGIAPVMIKTLDLLSAHPRSTQAPDELARQHSLDALEILEEPEARIDRITNSTRNLFGASGAAVTFIDHDRQWVKSSLGMTSTDSLRIGEFCDMTIRSNELLIVEDTTKDARFREHPSVTGPLGVRFYAGYPIESPDGRRVGALCIVDTRARVFSKQEASLLRDLTLQVQSELWAGVPGSASSLHRANRTESSIIPF